MQKNIIIYLIALGLLGVSLFFYSSAYEGVLQYTRLTEKNNAVRSSFQNLSEQTNNAAVINPDLVNAIGNEPVLTNIDNSFLFARTNYDQNTIGPFANNFCISLAR